MIGSIFVEGSDSVPRISLYLKVMPYFLNFLASPPVAMGGKMKSEITQHKLLNNKHFLKLKKSSLCQKRLHALPVLDRILLLILWEPIKAAYPVILTSVVIMGHCALNSRNSESSH